MAEPAFDRDDLRIAAEHKVPLKEVVEARDRQERRRRRSAARWVAILVLPVIAVAALGSLLLRPDHPPDWAQPALFSIMTAAIAFLFSHDKGGKD